MEFDYGVLKPVAPGLRRLVADNAGPFTFKGTNCYVVGERDVCVIDPGPNDVAHLETLKRIFSDLTISRIVLTHTHLDHSGAVRALQEWSGALTMGFKPEGGARGTGEDSPSGQDFADSGFDPDIAINDGDLIEGNGWALRAIHTPGHAPDHLCFDVAGSGALLSGDHVMSWNTSVIAPPEGNMGDYMRSLEKLLDLEHEVFFPGHGGRLERPQRVVKAFLVHRGWREAAILESIRNGDRTVDEIVQTVYRDIDPKMAKAAAFSVVAHAEFLLERGKLVCDEAPGGVPSLLSSFSLP